MVTLTPQTGENNDIIGYTLQAAFPADAPQIFEYAAKADGWRPQIHDTNGNLVENPESTTMRVLTNVIRMVFAAAIQQKAIEDADLARMQTISTMQATQQTWLESLK